MTFFKRLFKPKPVEPDLEDQDDAGDSDAPAVPQPRAFPKGVGDILGEMPDEWLIRENVTIDRMTVDYVAVSPYGVYCIFEPAKRGKVTSTPRGLYVNNEKIEPLPTDVTGVLKPLRKYLGVPLEPIMVFRDSDIMGSEVGSLKIFSPERLKTHLLFKVTPVHNDTELREVLKRINVLQEEAKKWRY